MSKDLLKLDNLKKFSDQEQLFYLTRLGMGLVKGDPINGLSTNEKKLAEDIIIFLVKIDTGMVSPSEIQPGVFAWRANDFMPEDEVILASSNKIDTQLRVIISNAAVAALHNYIANQQVFENETKVKHNPSLN